MVPGDSVTSGPGASIKVGNSLPLSAIPIGTALHNVEMNPGKGGQLARSAGTAARLVSRGMRSLHQHLTFGDKQHSLSMLVATECL